MGLWAHGPIVAVSLFHPTDHPMPPPTAAPLSPQNHSWIGNQDSLSKVMASTACASCAQRWSAPKSRWKHLTLKSFRVRHCFRYSAAALERFLKYIFISHLHVGWGSGQGCCKTQNINNQNEPNQFEFIRDEGGGWWGLYETQKQQHTKHKHATILHCKTGLWYHISAIM